MEQAPWVSKLRLAILDKTEVEEDAFRQQHREAAQMQHQRAQEEHGMGMHAANKQLSPGAERRVTRGSKKKKLERVFCPAQRRNQAHRGRGLPVHLSTVEPQLRTC
jgi:hypothetical protein